MEQATELIDILEIGGFNSLYSLANIVKEEFDTFSSEFLEFLKEILQIRTLIDEDPNQIFNVL